MLLAHALDIHEHVKKRLMEKFDLGIREYEFAEDFGIDVLLFSHLPHLMICAKASYTRTCAASWAQGHLHISCSFA